MYLRLHYLSNKAKFLENIIKHAINSTLGAVNLWVSNFMRKTLNGIIKEFTQDLEKKYAIYQFKFY